jgi:adenylate cyclase
MRYLEGRPEDGRLVEILSPRHLRFILIGTRATAWLAAAIRRVHQQAGTVLAACLAIAILIGGLTAAFFLGPLRDLRHAVKAIQRGDLTYRLALHRGDEFDDLAEAFNTMARGLQEGRILRRFVSGSVRRMVGGADAASLGPAPVASRRQSVTILFSQVRVVADCRSDPERLFACLEAHVRSIEEAVSRCGGEIDKIIGEKVLAVFPHDAFPEARLAASAAFQAAGQAARSLAQVPGVEAVAGGIATGEVVSGVLGAASVRLDHTVIGDPVNLAARLAGLAARQNGRAVALAAGEAVRLAGREGQCRLLDLVAVKGKTRSVEAWLVLE